MGNGLVPTRVIWQPCIHLQDLVVDYHDGMSIGNESLDLPTFEYLRFATISR
jgi:hypothetical protein